MPSYLGITVQGNISSESNGNFEYVTNPEEWLIFLENIQVFLEKIRTIFNAVLDMVVQVLNCIMANPLLLLFILLPLSLVAIQLTKRIMSMN